MGRTSSIDVGMPWRQSRGHAASSPVPDRFWGFAPERLMAALATRPRGLTTEEAAARLARLGPNAVIETTRRWLPAKIAKRLIEPLIAILILAATISGLTGDQASASIIVVILAISIGLDIIQEHRAEASAELLRRSVAIRTDVRRDGHTQALPVDEVVPGDVVELHTGDLVPADGVVLDSHGAHANEALLTGEAYPVEKRAGPCETATPAEAFNALFAGTALVSGNATMLVVATGAHSRFGGIAAALQSAAPPTSFERSLHALGILLLRLTAFLVLLVLLSHLAFGRPVLESFMFATALAIGLTPELLPMIVTVTLARGAVRMAQRQVIVKRLASIHDFGAMDVLCTDKTGTLTQARIALVGHPGSDGVDTARVLALAAVNSRFEQGMKSPLDDAILARAEEQALAGWSRIADVPFDFERRLVSVLAEREGRRWLVTKGAPEQVLARCAAVERADGRVVPLDEPMRRQLEAMHDEMAAHGRRCIGVAAREVSPRQQRATTADERDLVLAGFCVFEDPPKPSAAEAVVQLAALGVAVKIISGDAPRVVQHVVETLQLPSRGLTTGDEIEALNDLALADRAESCDVFARVSPDQKTRIIRALRARGHTVGFLGDGINDAPALHAADVGVSVDGATDVARASADMILLAPDLRVLVAGVEEGRRTYANIMKYVRMGTSSNFGNMLSMALASLVIPFLPLTPVQVLLNNLLYDLSETGIPFDRVDPPETAQPHHWSTAEVVRFTLVMGPLSSLFDIAAFVLLLAVLAVDPATFRTVWFVESISTQILVIFAIRTAGRAWTSRAHPILVATSLGALAAAWALALTPIGTAFGFAPLSWPLIALTIGLIAAYLIAAELLKRVAIQSALPAVAARERSCDGSISRATDAD